VGEGKVAVEGIEAALGGEKVVAEVSVVAKESSTAIKEANVVSEVNAASHEASAAGKVENVAAHAVRRVRELGVKKPGEPGMWMEDKELRRI
jgi:hypothetical protein